MLAANKLLKRQFPGLQGIHTSSTTPGLQCHLRTRGILCRRFVCLVTGTPKILFVIFFSTAVQIHYVPERKHWVTSSYRAGRVMLYDSCFNGKLSPSLEMQLVQLYCPALDNGTLMVTANSKMEHKTVGCLALHMLTISVPKIPPSWQSTNRLCAHICARTSRHRS